MKQEEFLKIVGCANVKRAIEVAVVARVGIIIIGKTGYGLDELESLYCHLESSVKEAATCNTFTFPSNEDMQTHINTVKRIHNERNHSMLVAMPPNYDFDSYAVRRFAGRASEPYEDIEHRVKQAICHTVKDKSINQSSRELMKVAFERLSLTYDNLDTIIKVAEAIARLDLSEKIETHHIAEAINYTPRMFSESDIKDYIQ